MLVSGGGLLEVNTAIGRGAGRILRRPTSIDDAPQGGRYRSPLAAVTKCAETAIPVIYLTPAHWLDG